MKKKLIKGGKLEFCILNIDTKCTLACVTYYLVSVDIVDIVDIWHRLFIVDS